jgi:hypothetical protein
MMVYIIDCYEYPDDHIVEVHRDHEKAKKRSEQLMERREGCEIYWMSEYEVIE